MLIIPANTIFTGRFREIFGERLKYVQYGMPDERFNFIKDGRIMAGCSFYSLFLFYKCDVSEGEDVIYV